MITATPSTQCHFEAADLICGGLRDDLSVALVSTWKTPPSTWLTPRALLPAAHKIYNGHYAAELPDACPNIFGIKNGYVVANHRQRCLPAASCRWGGERKEGQDNRNKWKGAGDKEWISLPWQRADYSRRKTENMWIARRTELPSAQIRLSICQKCKVIQFVRGFHWAHRQLFFPSG